MLSPICIRLLFFSRGVVRLLSLQSRCSLFIRSFLVPLFLDTSSSR